MYTMLSTRERITILLEQSSEFLDVEEIIDLLQLDEKPKVVYEHLKHIAKSVWRKSNGEKRLVMLLPRCKDCGYVFKDLEEPWKPNKCPRCKSRRIEPPRFKIVHIQKSKK